MKQKNPSKTMLFFLFFLWLGQAGCPSTTSNTHTRTPSKPDEKLYTLQVDQKNKIPINENTALVYRFDVDIQSDGLYVFETLGDADTLCALVREEKAKEHFLIVRDTGGKKENCEIVWAFPPGRHRFKVRVDGNSHFWVWLRRISWNKVVQHPLPTDAKPFEGLIEEIKDRHRFRFTLKAPRLVHIEVRGKQQLQCILRSPEGKWLVDPGFHQPFGTCTVGQWLQPGQYDFELRSNRPQGKYTLKFQKIRMQKLASDQVLEGYIQPKVFDVFQLQLKANRRHIIATHGKRALRCQLEDRLGHVIKKARIAPDDHNCLLDGQFAPGKYYLRVALRRGAGGSYLASLRQQTYQLIETSTKKQIYPNFQTPMQLFKFEIKKPRLYQLKVSGRDVRCLLNSTDEHDLFLMNLSERKQCLLFAHLQPGGYFLQLYPKDRLEKPYLLEMIEYSPSRGDLLEEQRPRLLGPAYQGYRRTLQLRVKQPQLVTLETRGHLDTNCSLTTGGGQKIAYDDDSGDRYNCRLKRYLKPGTYRLKVSINRFRSQDARRGGALFWVQRRAQHLPWIVLGKNLHGTLKSTKKPHTFLLKVPQTGMFGIRTNGPTDTKCNLLNDDWKSIASDDDSGEGRNCFLTWVLTPGIYPIQIRMYRKGGPYQLLVDYLRPQLLSPGKTINGRLSPPSWTTFYRVDITQRNLYVLKTKGNVDTNCSLLDDHGKQILHNDDAKSGDKNCAILSNLERGTYYFRVKLFRSNKASPEQLHRFQVFFDQLRLKIRTITPGTTIKDRLEQGGIKEFRFKVSKAGWYNIETRGNQADPKCQLFVAPSRRRIARDDDSGIARNCRIRRNLAPGEYLFQVRTASDSKYSTGNFQLVVTRQSN